MDGRRLLYSLELHSQAWCKMRFQMFPFDKHVRKNFTCSFERNFEMIEFYCVQTIALHLQSWKLCLQRWCVEFYQWNHPLWSNKLHASCLTRFWNWQTCPIKESQICLDTWKLVIGRLWSGAFQAQKQTHHAQPHDIRAFCLYFMDKFCDSYWSHSRQNGFIGNFTTGPGKHFQFINRQPATHWYNNCSIRCEFAHKTLSCTKKYIFSLDPFLHIPCFWSSHRICYIALHQILVRWSQNHNRNTTRDSPCAREGDQRKNAKRSQHAFSDFLGHGVSAFQSNLLANHAIYLKETVFLKACKM